MALSSRYLQAALSGEGRFRLASQTPASVAAGHELVRRRREREAAIDDVVFRKYHERIFGIFFRRHKTREAARIALSNENDAEYLAALALHQDEIETLEHLMDRLETSDLRQTGEGFCIIPNTEFGLIREEYEAMGFAHEDGTHHVVAAAQDLRDKMLAKKPVKAPTKPKPEPRPSIISKKKNRNMDL